jgi:hypothetical protein
MSFERRFRAVRRRSARPASQTLGALAKDSCPGCASATVDWVRRFLFEKLNALSSMFIAIYKQMV